ncbi:uncharacterized protein EI97DRAFT_376289 [Westerdykella ornata]|uniref:Uncharacterized protein n=1 Tax=Westerdykella ornata TaxID=318751 RepID=A0A6A6JJM7_WESOR|nr:uncharacterized protein EI97DRAFT_376289 [Westerdykella ornata]KAF2276697.1 hypothetical protein EI97DRAFT_376289 [Westerdykella ornata]
MVYHARYKRRPQPTFNQPFHLAEPNVPTIRHSHRLEPPLPSSRKRERERSAQRQPNETSQPRLKKQRLSHSSGSQPPAAFWDNLSKIWLTKQALRELDRRNNQAAPRPPCSPVTPNFAARRKKNCQNVQYAAHYLCFCKPRILKDIKSLARHGGPDLSDLRNFPEPIHSSEHTMSSSRSTSRSRHQSSATLSSTKPTTSTTKTKSTGAYSRNFHQHLVDHAIYPDAYEYPDGSVPAEPNNWEDLVLAQLRPSLSPSQFSDGKFREFKRADAHATKENQVSELVIPIIEGKIRDAKCRSGGIPFNNLDPLTDGTLKPGNPDVYYGARPEQRSREIRDELGGHIIPSTQHVLPLAPNFFLAAKGPDGSAAVAKRQACYDGALGARGMHSLQSHGRVEPVYDNNAYTVTSTYHDGTLKMYTSHVASPCTPGGRPEYHMTQINSWGMTGNARTFRQGATAYRNARDWCKHKRDEAISQANERTYPVEAEAMTSDAGASPAPSFVTAVSETEAYESDSSIEGFVKYTLPAKRSSKRSKQTGRKRRK